MGRIKIRHNLDPRDNNTKLKLLELLTPHKVNICKLTSTNDGSLVAVTATDADADRLLDNSTLKTLNDAGFDPILPPEVRSRRTVICHRIDEIIYNNSHQEISDEIERKHTWSKVKSVYKFPSQNKYNCTFKVEFADADMAFKAVNDGIRLFNMSIASHQITRESYIHITTCLRCYAIEKHSTSACPHPADYLVCSECASEGHTWKQCNNGFKKCLNCSGAHRTLAMSCSKRKEAVAIKKQAQQQSSTKSYAQTASKSAPPQQEQVQMKNMTATLPTIWFSYFYALTLDAVKPGTFQTVLNDTLAANNLPSIKVPYAPPSMEILENIMGNITSNTLSPSNKATANTSPHHLPTPTATTSNSQAKSKETETVLQPNQAMIKKKEKELSDYHRQERDTREVESNPSTPQQNETETESESESDCSSTTVGTPSITNQISEEETEEELPQITSPLKSTTKGKGKGKKQTKSTATSLNQSQHHNPTETARLVRTLRPKQ